MTFSQSIGVCLSKYADFKGRASRSEYWWFVLFIVLIAAAASLVSGTLYALTTLALLLPHAAVSVRRLHDIDRNGWWILLGLIPLVNLLLIYWYCLKGDETSNQYGEAIAL